MIGNEIEIIRFNNRNVTEYYTKILNCLQPMVDISCFVLSNSYWRNNNYNWIMYLFYYHINVGNENFVDLYPFLKEDHIDIFQLINNDYNITRNFYDPIFHSVVTYFTEFKEYCSSNSHVDKNFDSNELIIFQRVQMINYILQSMVMFLEIPDFQISNCHIQNINDFYSYFNRIKENRILQIFKAFVKSEGNSRICLVDRKSENVKGFENLIIENNFHILLTLMRFL